IAFLTAAGSRIHGGHQHHGHAAAPRDRDTTGCHREPVVDASSPNDGAHAPADRDPHCGTDVHTDCAADSAADPTADTRANADADAAADADPSAANAERRHRTGGRHEI